MGTTRPRNITAPEPFKPSHRPASVSPEDRRVQIAAARLKVVLDERLERQTPDWVLALAAEKPE